MVNATLQEKTHDDDNAIDDKGSMMSATPLSNSQYITWSHVQPSHRTKPKLYDYIVVSINKLISTFHQANTNMSQNMYGNSEDHNYIVEEITSMGLSMDDELMALHLMVKKPSNIRAFKA